MVAKICEMGVHSTLLHTPNLTKRRLIVNPIVGVEGTTGVQHGDRRDVEL